MRKTTIVMLFLLLTFTTSNAQSTATLEVRANGEDFVRQGFVSKDGWTISFEHVFVVLEQIRAYQTAPPYDPFAGELTRSNSMVGLPGQFTVDLAEGDENAAPILIGVVDDAPGGYYNAVSWAMVLGDDGYSILMEGTAEKDGEQVEFIIRIDETYTYDCGAFIGDERKGILANGMNGDVELTFHFDHIFGDAETPLGDSLNMGAPGFDLFAALAVDGVLDVSLSGLKTLVSEADYQLLVDVLPSLGHTGEGHCHAY